MKIYRVVTEKDGKEVEGKDTEIIQVNRYYVAEDVRSVWEAIQYLFDWEIEYLKAIIEEHSGVIVLKSNENNTM
jgi:hypothetical protein